MSDHRLKQRLERTKVDEGIAEIDKAIRDFDNHIESGFQLATFQGPLCAEPVVGMAYFVEQIDIDIKSLKSEIGKFQQSNFAIQLTFNPSFRTKQDATSNWFFRILFQRCM